MIVVEESASRRWAYGLVADEVATVELVDGEGEVVTSVDVLRDAGHAGWVIELPGGGVQYENHEIVARSAGGDQLARDQPSLG